MSETEKFAVAVPLPGGTPPVTVPKGSAATSGIPMWQQEKQGAKCCGCCCDYRRAVIIIAIIFICIAVISIILTVAAVSVPSYSIEIDDDAVLEIWDEGLKRAAIFSGIGLFFSICALVGAQKFNVMLIAVNIVWLVANCKLLAFLAAER
jgi:hypothetical protein